MAEIKEGEGWDRSAQYVLAELARLANCYEKLDERFRNELMHIREMITEHQASIARLEVRAGLWAALGAAIPALISLAIYIFTR